MECSIMYLGSLGLYSPVLSAALQRQTLHPLPALPHQALGDAPLLAPGQGGGLPHHPGGHTAHSPRAPGRVPRLLGMVCIIARQLSPGVHRLHGTHSVVLGVPLDKQPAGRRPPSLPRRRRLHELVQRHRVCHFTSLSVQFTLSHLIKIIVHLRFVMFHG